ncbi:MAG TPA: NAD(P)/FAD-dependent oxidoreductase [Streptosporangiaceae bacterium]|nr:NAD(P)/FAD-dependent oxidoreductase [Streptosporangiaceae bacterium]
MSTENEHFVLVIGGGPAGSVAAAALARSGLRVRLIEAARFPRYHIGESLTPSCRAVLDAIGLSEKLDSHGFVLKYGGAFRWDSDAWFFDWGAMLGINAWQVDRAEFDEVLLDHAVASGVDVKTGVTARAVTFENGRPASVTCVPDDGEPFTIEGFTHLIDASGRAGLLSARHFRTRHVEPTLRNIAIWGYWGSTAVLPDTPAGGINIISSPTGWYWIIPLAGGRTSIGFVTRKDHFATRRPAFGSVDEMYLALVKESATVRGLVGDAEYLGPVRVETDYSYAAERFCGPGYLIVGDAACFLDPLLSTGVQLAMYSALTAAACVASVHRGEVTEEAAHGFFEYAFRRAYARLFALVNVMYERYLGKDGFFGVSDRLVGATPGEHDGAAGAASSSSFVEIIAGLSDLREAGDAETRVLTEQLITEALDVQERVIGASGGPGQPDFTSVLEDPLRDAESADYRLVTSPRLGLEPAADRD